MDCLNNSWSRRIANMYSRISECTEKSLQFYYPMYLHYKLCISVYTGLFTSCAILSFSIFHLQTIPLFWNSPKMIVYLLRHKKKILPSLKLSHWWWLWKRNKRGWIFPWRVYTITLSDDEFKGILEFCSGTSVGIKVAFYEIDSNLETIFIGSLQLF